MPAYYNEFDKKKAALLEELIRQDLIAPGDVDDRPIEEVKPDDVRKYTQCHFFAGIGGWSYALRLAGYDDDRPIWTGSCPCQPFSIAGLEKGKDDPRDLWPVLSRIIRECKPSTVMGEQVPRSILHGWIDRAFDDLEDAGYACWAAVLPASAFGANHVRERLYWAASTDASSSRRRRITLKQKKRTWDALQFEKLLQGELRLVVPTGRFGALSYGLPSRMVQLRGYGNAIVPQVAAAFIEASETC